LRLRSGWTTVLVTATPHTVWLLLPHLYAALPPLPASLPLLRTVCAPHAPHARPTHAHATHTVAPHHAHHAHTLPPPRTALYRFYTPHAFAFAAPGFRCRFTHGLVYTHRSHWFGLVLGSHVLFCLVYAHTLLRFTGCVYTHRYTFTRTHGLRIARSHAHTAHHTTTMHFAPHTFCTFTGLVFTPHTLHALAPRAHYAAHCTRVAHRFALQVYLCCYATRARAFTTRTTQHHAHYHTSLAPAAPTAAPRRFCATTCLHCRMPFAGWLNALRFTPHLARERAARFPRCRVLFTFAPAHARTRGFYHRAHRVYALWVWFARAHAGLHHTRTALHTCGLRVTRFVATVHHRTHVWFTRLLCVLRFSVYAPVTPVPVYTL